MYTSSPSGGEEDGGEQTMQSYTSGADAVITQSAQHIATIRRQRQSHANVMKEFATTKLFDGTSVISQGVFLRTIMQPGAPDKEVSELFQFHRPPSHRPHSNASSVCLAMTIKQHDVMYALAGCSDVASVMSNVSKQVREGLRQLYGIDKPQLTTWFKNRRRRKEPRHKRSAVLSKLPPRQALPPVQPQQQQQKQQQDDSSAVDSRSPCVCDSVSAAALPCMDLGQGQCRVSPQQQQQQQLVQANTEIRRRSADLGSAGTWYSLPPEAVAAIAAAAAKAAAAALAAELLESGAENRNEPEHAMSDEFWDVDDDTFGMSADVSPVHEQPAVHESQYQAQQSARQYEELHGHVNQQSYRRQQLQYGHSSPGQKANWQATQPAHPQMAIATPPQGGINSFQPYPCHGSALPHTQEDKEATALGHSAQHHRREGKAGQPSQPAGRQHCSAPAFLHDHIRIGDTDGPWKENDGIFFL